MELYMNIKERRKELGMTQERLAHLMGYTDRSSIAKIEGGKVDLPQSKLEQFAKVLHTTPGELMGDTEIKEKPTEDDGLSGNIKDLMDFVKTVPEDKAELVLKLMRTIVEDE